MIPTAADFSEIFESLARFLESQGEELKMNRPKPADPEALEIFTRETGIVLPESFSSFHTCFSDGFACLWNSDEDEEGGGIHIPSLRKLAERRLEWARNVSDFADDPESMDRCVKPQHRERAFALWEASRNWVPIVEETNGDSYCLRPEDGCIVFNKHDWFDGFGSLDQTNGLIAGHDLLDFLRNWSRLSFIDMDFHNDHRDPARTGATWTLPGSRFVRGN